MDVTGISVRNDGGWGDSWILRVGKRPIVMNDKWSFVLAREVFLAEFQTQSAEGTHD